MPGITKQITDLLVAYFNASGASWLMPLSGQLFRETEIPETAVAPFAEWGWVLQIDESTGLQRHEIDHFQIIFYGNDDIALNEIRDAADISLHTTVYGFADIGFNILVRKEIGLGFRAMKNEGTKKDRFGKFMAMSQFRFRVQSELIPIP